MRNEDAKKEAAMDGGLDISDRPSRARYDKVRATLDRKWRRRQLDCDRMMREVVDVLWDNFGGNPYSWCGFYRLSKDGESLTLGPHRDKPACSPLPMHGVCGDVVKSLTARIVPDLGALGEGHVVCDPKSRSEIVVPVFNADGSLYAVFDVDSEQVGAFDEMDQRWLERIVKRFQEVGAAG